MNLFLHLNLFIYYRNIVFTVRITGMFTLAIASFNGKVCHCKSKIPTDVSPTYKLHMFYVTDNININSKAPKCHVQNKNGMKTHKPSLMVNEKSKKTILDL